MLKKRLILYILFSLILLKGWGQYYNTGQSPSSFRWHQLKTDHFYFIFPETYDHEIFKTASRFEDAWNLIGGKYGEVELKNMPVIINNHSTESNGYVAWAPSRIEIYPLPDQDNIPLGHISQLALHELDHVAQMKGLTQGISKPLSYIFGEQYTGALAIYSPSWFMEGEAVLTETIHSGSGRGRAPSFEKHLKALLVENEYIFSYDKMIGGSYRDFAPDHYRFGYQMAAWTVKEFGDDIWRYPVDMASRKPYSINPFNISLKRKTGLKKVDIYRQTMGWLRENWIKEVKELKYTEPELISPMKGDDYINYYSPIAVGSDSIIAMKTSLYDIPRIVLINPSDSSETNLFTPGYMWPQRISFSRGIIVWAEHRKDPRWDNRGYSVIMKRDITNNFTTQLSSKTRWFSPDISPDGLFIVATETDPGGINYLITLETATGELVSRTATPDNIMPIAPKWSADMSKIIFIAYSDDGEGIMSYNPEQSVWETHIPQSNEDLESVQERSDTIFYVSSSSGTENIYFVDKENRRKRIGSSKFGAVNISLDGDRILFSDYRSNGYNLGSLSISENSTDVDNSKTTEPLLIGYIDSDRKLGDVEPEPSGSYVIEKYRKGLHLFKFHSWMPFYTDIDKFSFDNLPVRLGVTLMSQNHLTTLTTTMGYEYRDGEHRLHSKVSYQGLLPAFDFDVTYGGTPAIIQDNDITFSPSVIYPGFKATGSVYIPLYFNSGRYNQTLWPSYSFSYSNNYIFDEDLNTYDYGQLTGTLRLYFSNYLRRAYRDIWPRFGQAVEFIHSNSPTDSDLYGVANVFKTTLYFPGIFRNNSIRLRYQSEKQVFAKYLYYNHVSFPRGYKHIISGDINSYSIDYSLPLAYPDFNLGSLIYLKRIRSVLFYDFATGNNNYYVTEKILIEEQENFSSIGAELVADFNILRIPFGFSGGVQAAWLPLKNEPYFNLILNIDIFGFVLGRENSNYF